MAQEETLAQKAGRNLKRLLDEKHLTQSVAANIIGASEDRTVRRWIKDGIDKLSTIEYIAEAFGVSVYDLLK